MTEIQWRNRVKRTINAGRKVAHLRGVIWATATALPARKIFKTTDDLASELATSVNEVTALRLVAEAACNKLGLNFKKEFGRTLKFVRSQAGHAGL